MVLIATFGVSEAGLPTIAELSLMPVTNQWLPVEDSFDRQLVDRLVRDGRSFVKGLRYNMSSQQQLASAVLTDAGVSPIALHIAPRGSDNQQMDDSLKDLESANASPAWIWDSVQGTMPHLPRKIWTPEAA